MTRPKYPLCGSTKPISIELWSKGSVHKGFALCRSTDQVVKQSNRVKDVLLQAPWAGNPFISSTNGSHTDPFSKWRCFPKHKTTHFTTFDGIHRY
jgi:hypothetical protein